MMKYLAAALIVITSTPVFAEPLRDTLRQPHEPGYFSVLLSLVFVVCLIYATGLIYNKLNHLGIKTFKAQNKEFAKDKITILSTTPLGANRTLHVIELDGRKMIIGASANSIHLIKDLSEEDNLDAVVKDNSDSVFDSAAVVNASEEVKNPDLDEEFGLYKKYLR